MSKVVQKEPTQMIAVFTGQLNAVSMGVRRGSVAPLNSNFRVFRGSPRENADISKNPRLCSKCNRKYRHEICIRSFVSWLSSHEVLYLIHIFTTYVEDGGSSCKALTERWCVRVWCWQVNVTNVFSICMQMKVSKRMTLFIIFNNRHLLTMCWSCRAHEKRVSFYAHTHTLICVFCMCVCVRSCPRAPVYVCLRVSLLVRYERMVFRFSASDFHSLSLSRVGFLYTHAHWFDKMLDLTHFIILIQTVLHIEQQGTGREFEYKVKWVKKSVEEQWYK